MNFAQIWVFPTDSLNGKSMGARDSRSLKDNVSKCQLLELRSSPPESAVRAISMGLSGMKGETAWQGRSWPKEPSLPLALHLLCPWKLSWSSPADSFQGRVLLTMQSGKGILPTWHHLDHVPYKQKPKQQSCTLTSVCLSKGPCEVSPSWWLSACRAAPQAHVGGRTFLLPKQNLPLQADS